MTSRIPFFLVVLIATFSCLHMNSYAATQLVAEAGGTNYQWYKMNVDGSGGPIIGATNRTLSIDEPGVYHAEFEVGGAFRATGFHFATTDTNITLEADGSISSNYIWRQRGTVGGWSTIPGQNQNTLNITASASPTFYEAKTAASGNQYITSSFAVQLMAMMMVEDCSNGIDDDGDNLIDCLDTDDCDCGHIPPANLAECIVLTDLNMCVPTATGNTATIHLNGINSGTWTILSNPDGNGSVNDPTNGASPFYGTVGQTYTLEWDQGSTQDTITVSLTNGAVTANAGPDQTVMTGTPATLSASPTPGYWRIINDDGNVNISNYSDPNAILTSTANDVSYSLVWTHDVASPCRSQDIVKVCFGTCFTGVFITSERYTGDLGGIAGADSICQAHADAAGLSGIWFAWLGTTDTFSHPLQRFHTGTYPVQTTVGEYYADSLRGAGIKSNPLAMVEHNAWGTPACEPTRCWNNDPGNPNNSVSCGDPGFSAPGFSPSDSCSTKFSEMCTGYFAVGDTDNTGNLVTTANTVRRYRCCDASDPNRPGREWYQGFPTEFGTWLSNIEGRKPWSGTSQIGNWNINEVHTCVYSTGTNDIDLCEGNEDHAMEPFGNDCNGWTSSSSSLDGTRGHNVWHRTHDLGCHNDDACDGDNPIYCFEQ